MIHKFILLVALPLLLISCAGKDKTQDQLRQIDSIVNAKVHQREVENATKNDSTLKAVEAARADAILKQRNDAAATVKKTDTVVHAPTSIPLKK